MTDDVLEHLINKVEHSLSVARAPPNLGAFRTIGAMARTLSCRELLIMTCNRMCRLLIMSNEPRTAIANKNRLN